MTFAKTIFIPIFLGHQARNILQTDIFDLLKKDKKTRIVIFTKPVKVDLYRKKYGADNVFIEGFNYEAVGKLEGLLQNLCLIGVDVETVKRRQLRDLYSGGSHVLYLTKRLLTKAFGKIKLLQKLLRQIDYLFLYNDTPEKFFKKYRPDLVFCPHVLARFDLLFLKTSKKFGVKSIAVVNSWDNLSSRGMMRFFPDHLIVHNEVIRKEAISLNGYPENRISVVGIPHFDYYTSDERSSREDFYNRVKIPPDKEIILFCPAGSRMNDTEWQVIKMLDDAIKEGKINFLAHMLVRQPPNADMVMGELKGSENTTFDRMSHKFETGDSNDWEWTKDDMIHLADSLYYSKMVINYASTMTIDAAAFNKPVINIVFDGWEKKNKRDSFSWFYYNRTHYKNASDTGGIRHVYSIDQLIRAINDYYLNPNLDRESRNNIVKQQCWKLDGQSGRRVSEIIHRLLYSP